MLHVPNWSRAASTAQLCSQHRINIWLRDAVKPNTLTRSLTLTHTHTYTVDHGAGWLVGWQADRWCADNVVSLEQRTKALRAAQEIHLAEMGAGRQGEPDWMGIVEGERRVVVVAAAGGWVGVCTRVCPDIPESHVTALILKWRGESVSSSVFLGQCSPSSFPKWQMLSLCHHADPPPPTRLHFS